jgi:hypothetical protein
MEEGSRFTRSAPAGRADPQRLVLATAFQVSRFENTLAAGDIVHWIRIEGAATELYDVAVLPGVRVTIRQSLYPIFALKSVMGPFAEVTQRECKHRKSRANLYA